MSKGCEFDEITVAGTRIHLRRKGTGRALLFLHGIVGAVPTAPFFDRLAIDHTILIPDHPGFGRSDLPQWLRGIGDMAYFYLDFIEQLGLRDLDIIGHSLGGWIAAEVAIRDTRMVRSLTLISPAGVRRKGTQPGDFYLWSPQERASNLVYDQGLVPKIFSIADDQASLETELKNAYAGARLAWQPRFHNPELQRWLHRIRIPVQIIWGEQDKLLPLEIAEIWTDALPDARLSTISNCGHLPHVERPDETLSVARSFLREIAA